MTKNEFDIIQHFFNKKTVRHPDTLLSIGDDAALIRIPSDYELVVTTDTLVNSVHFPETTSPYDIGFKSLAVNLSDLAAMGATPTWFTLALTLPEYSDTWLKDFSQGLFELANRYSVELIGGDTTKGPLSITIQAMGLVPQNQALRRDGAKIHDLIYVTHQIGDAALGLACINKKIRLDNISSEYLSNKLNRPEPCIDIGIKLRGIATSAIDISDGLAADLQHILEKSRVGAKIIVDHLPLSPPLKKQENSFEYALNGGDDYELCFTVPSDKKHLLDFDCTCIGVITEWKGLEITYSNGEPYKKSISGYQHF